MIVQNKTFYKKLSNIAGYSSICKISFLEFAPQKRVYKINDLGSDNEAHFYLDLPYTQFFLKEITKANLLCMLLCH